MKITSKALGHNRISVIAEHYLNNCLVFKIILHIKNEA